MSQTTTGKSTSTKLIAVGIIAVIVGLAGGWGLSQATAQTGTGSKFVVTQGVFDEISRIKTVQDAERAGYKPLGPPGAPPQCVPDMGMHYSKNPLATRDGKPFPDVPLLLFNKQGELIGIELESLTPQPTPPWEHLPRGHPGMEFEHWTLHIYIKEPRGACG